MSVVPASDDLGKVEAANREVVASTSKKGTTRQKNYVLNDVGALKKKITHEKRQLDYSLAKEAKDFSNVVIQMRASFFEYVKSYFISELEDNQNITKIENAVRSKAATESSMEAYVEYSLEISFVSDVHTHSVILTAYTTTSQIMIQPINEKPGIIEHLGNRSSPRFFAETYFLPWSNKAIKENRFDDKMRDTFIQAIKDQIKRLDLTKMEQRKSGYVE